MTDAVPQFLDPALGATVSRPPGLRAGDFPRQTAAATLRFWSLGVSSRGLRLPVAESVGTPCHLDYDTNGIPLVAIDSRGDPEHPDDHSLIQFCQDALPQVNRVFTTWFWCDWRHLVDAVNASYNRGIGSRTGNAYLGQQTRQGVERPCLAITSASANGGTALTQLTNITLAAPGSASGPGYDCPLVSEAGTAPAPVPLRIPCWVGRTGFRGAAGQVLAGGASTQHFGPFLRLKPRTQALTENAPGLRLELTTGTMEVGAELFAAFGYTLAHLLPAVTYLAPDFDQPGPVFPCIAYGQRCWRDLERTAYMQLFLTPLGDAWQAVVAIQQVYSNRTAGGGRFVNYSNFNAIFHTQSAGVAQTSPADDVSATPIAIGATTTITRPLLQGAATLTITVTVSATGIVTRCEAAITRQVAVTNLGAGWHDTFYQL